MRFLTCLSWRLFSSALRWARAAQVLCVLRVEPPREPQARPCREKRQGGLLLRALAAFFVLPSFLL
eukprot:41066-Rhodomonas_salina.2